MAGIASGSVAGVSIAALQIATFGTQDQGAVYNYAPGTSTFTAPKAGYWKVALWGHGYSTLAEANGGDSGALAIKTRFLRVGEQVTLLVGAPGDANDTKATFADGVVVTAGRATASGGAGPGVATGGDTNINGSAGALAGVTGAAAPSSGTFQGGPAAVSSPGNSPGGGAGSGTASGGSGQAIVLFVRP